MPVHVNKIVLLDSIIAPERGVPKVTKGLVLSIVKIIHVELPALSYTLKRYVHSAVIPEPVVNHVLMYEFPSPLSIAHERLISEKEIVTHVVL